MTDKRKETDWERAQRLELFFEKVEQQANRAGGGTEDDINNSVDFALLQNGDLKQDFKTYSGVKRYEF
jgi:hypothetical protein